MPEIQAPTQPRHLASASIESITGELQALKDYLRVLIVGLYITIVLKILLRAILWVRDGGEFSLEN